jgi:hypothetical protein
MMQFHTWISSKFCTVQIVGLIVAEAARRMTGQTGRNAMSDSDDFSQLDDPEFLSERRRVREELEHTPEKELSPELTARYQQLDDEFLRRASAAWTQAS